VRKTQLDPFKSAFFEKDNPQYSGKSIKSEQEEKECFEYSSRIQQLTIWGLLQLEVEPTALFHKHRVQSLLHLEKRG